MPTGADVRLNDLEPDSSNSGNLSVPSNAGNVAAAVESEGRGRSGEMSAGPQPGSKPATDGIRPKPKKPKKKPKKKLGLKPPDCGAAMPSASSSNRDSDEDDSDGSSDLDEDYSDDEDEGTEGYKKG